MFLDYNTFKKLSEERKKDYIKYLESDIIEFKKYLDEGYEKIKFENSVFSETLAIFISIFLGILKCISNI